MMLNNAVENQISKNQESSTSELRIKWNGIYLGEMYLVHAL